MPTTKIVGLVLKHSNTHFKGVDCLFMPPRRRLPRPEAMCIRVVRPEAHNHEAVTVVLIVNKSHATPEPTVCRRHSIIKQNFPAMNPRRLGTL